MCIYVYVYAYVYVYFVPISNISLQRQDELITCPVTALSNMQIVSVQHPIKLHNGISPAIDGETHNDTGNANAQGFLPPIHEEL